MELQARRDQFRMEELRQQHLLEKRQLPKRLKAEHKGQVAELRKAVRSKKVENSKEKFKKVRRETWYLWMHQALGSCTLHPPQHAVG